MTHVNNFRLLSLLLGAFMLAGCPVLTGDDDDSATDDDDSASDDDDSVGDDDDSAAGTTCGDLQGAWDACALAGGWDGSSVDFCDMVGQWPAADQDDFIGCAEGALLALDCSSVTDASGATSALEDYLRATDGCTDFAPTPQMSLDGIEIECSEEAGPGNQHSSWSVELNVTPGWIGADTLSLFLWDGNTFDANWANDVHYTDAWLPLTAWDNTESGDFSSFDTWTLDFDGYSDFGDAETNEGTFLKCVDSNGVPQIENRDFMVCATDFTYEDVTECWFCGNFLGEAAGTNSVDYGTVGSYTDGTDTWSSTIDFTDTAAADYPRFYTVL